MSQLDEIKSRIDIVDLVGETVKLRRAGKNYSGLCPFHNEKTPSFIVSPDRQTWHCFGQCSEGGDIFKFVMKKEGWDFKEALRYLADRAGVKLEAYQAGSPKKKKPTSACARSLEEAVTFYRYHLSTPAGKFALDYIHEKRHLTDATIETFGLGYAPEAGTTPSSISTEKAIPTRNCSTWVWFPQRRFGRISRPLPQPSDVPHPRRERQNDRLRRAHPRPERCPQVHEFARNAAFQQEPPALRAGPGAQTHPRPDQAVIVEGYLDVIALHQAGFENVVSPMGTALTEDQLRLLKKFTRRIVLALDPDAAGQKAVLRGLEAARQTLDRTG